MADGAKNETIEVNTMLDEDNKRSWELGIVIHPSVVINNMTYRGDIEADDIFSAICVGFETRPDICKAVNFRSIMLQSNNGETPR